MWVVIPPDISDWENCKNIPSVESLIKLAQALQTTETWLVSGKNPDTCRHNDDTLKIRQISIDSGSWDRDNGSITQWEIEMIRDKNQIIELQKEKIRDLEARLARLEGEGKPSKKLAG